MTHDAQSQRLLLPRPAQTLAATTVKRDRAPPTRRVQLTASVAAASDVERVTAKLLRRWRLHIRTIFVPCRMCQAGPGDPCKYKGREIHGPIACYHGSKLPKEERRFHYKRIDDAITIANILAMKEAA